MMTVTWTSWPGVTAIGVIVAKLRVLTRLTEPPVPFWQSSKVWFWRR